MAQNSQINGRLRIFIIWWNQESENYSQVILMKDSGLRGGYLNIIIILSYKTNQLNLEVKTKSLLAALSVGTMKAKLVHKLFIHIRIPAAL